MQSQLRNNSFSGAAKTNDLFSDSATITPPSVNKRETEDMKLQLKMLREENLQLGQRVKVAESEREDIEKQLVDAKIQSANLDLENDELACKHQKMSDQLKVFSKRITALEVELLKSK